MRQVFYGCLMFLSLSRVFYVSGVNLTLQHLISYSYLCGVFISYGGVKGCQPHL